MASRSRSAASVEMRNGYRFDSYGMDKPRGSKRTEHFHRAHAEAAGGEEAAGDIVGRGGIEADLSDAQFGKSGDGRVNEVASDSLPAVGGFYPHVVDEAELFE